VTYLDECVELGPGMGWLEGYRFQVGWAIFTGIDGEDPSLAAFVAGREDRAWALTACQDADGDPLFFDALVLPALLLDDGKIWVANTSEVQTHQELIQALKRHGKAHEKFPELDE
jgi:hypothetical protein